MLVRFGAKVHGIRNRGMIMTKKGFTLIEVLTVVVIVSILTAVALPRYSKFVNRSRFTKAQVMAKALYESCERQVYEFGFESRRDLSAVRADKIGISNLDIGDTRDLPAGFTISNDDKSISGAGFMYALKNFSCNVTITKEGDNSFYIEYSESGLKCYGTEKKCDAYGVDWDNEED